jgi:signal transduction histidine kinase
VRYQTPVFLEEHYEPYDRWFENRIYPSPDGLSIFFSDVTEKKKSDEKLRATNRQLRALSARIDGAREQEAVRIAREIHDELGQLLTGLKLEVSGLRGRLTRLEGEEAKDLQARAEDVATLADELHRSVHRISEELRPAALDQLGLEAALASHLFSLRQRSGIAASLKGGLDERRLPGAVETGVFRIVQELLTNVMRHAGATKVCVELHLEGGCLVARVTDDGRGIRPEEEAGSLGLLGIKERALLLNGTFEIHGGEGGTEAVLTIPEDGGTAS